MRKTQLLLLVLGFLCPVFVPGQTMNNKTLQKILEIEVDSLEGNLGYWQFKINDRFLLLITDEQANRMRIISPIAEVEQLEDEHIKNALIANFHTALDVKYAISDGLMWSVFIHPLGELQDHQVKDALSQVYLAAATFGLTYSSTDLVFPGNSGKEEPIEKEKPQKKKKTKRI